MFTDIHSHILPNIDDGANSIEESQKLLRMLAQQGVSNVIATPHFYSNLCGNPELRLQAVKKAYSKMLSECDTCGLNIQVGHEVHYFKGISDVEEIKLLAFPGGKYILVELPYGGFNKAVIDEIVEMRYNFGIIPIMAHIERYNTCTGFTSLLRMIEKGELIGQANCPSLLRMHFRRITLPLIEKGYVSFLASDCHGSIVRPPVFTEAFNMIDKKLGPEFSARLKDNSNRLSEELKVK